MDPDATLRTIRNITQEIESGEYDDAGAILDQFNDYVSALDDWLSIGGFLPRAWGKSSQA